MSILKWLRGLFPSDESERERGYEYCMAEIRKGRNIEELEILSDDPFNFTPFDAGMKDALWDWAASNSVKTGGCSMSNTTQQVDPRLSACIVALRACRETFVHYNERQLGMESTNIRMAGVCEDAIAKALDGAVTAGDVYRISSDRTAAVSTESTFFSMDSCPISRKVILLGAGGVATVGQYNGLDTFWQGWHPLPGRAR